MRRRAFAIATAALIGSAVFLACLALLLWGTPKNGNAKEEAARPDFYGLTNVVKLHVEIPADEFQAMQPPAPVGVPGGPPPAAPAPKGPGERQSERNLFGVEFPWARGAITSGGKSYPKVGLRYSGNASYM